MFVDSKGRILVGNTGGYHIIDPDAMKGTDGHVNKPFVVDLMIKDRGTIELETSQIRESFLAQKSVVLDNDQNDLSFELGFIDYTNSARNPEILYQLTNYHNTWSKASSGDIVSYFKIPPGDYTFVVKAKDLYGNWGQEEIAVTIQPPWYKSSMAYVLYGFGIIALIFSIDRIQRRSLIAQERKRARDRELAQAREIEKAYTQLKATQAQLIHAEKMVSLGELTAGIAHEIQNPLNFVNNFPEVTEEMLEELVEELEKDDVREAKKIAKNLKSNLNKISQHGSRASNIVSGMLAHSRNNSGERELTDINALCQEYIRLAFHGLRARDKTFSAIYETQLDPQLPAIKVAPQEIGRVILNC